MSHYSRVRLLALGKVVLQPMENAGPVVLCNVRGDFPLVQCCAFSHLNTPSSISSDEEFPPQAAHLSSRTLHEGWHGDDIKDLC